MRLALKLNPAWRLQRPPADRRRWLLRAIALRRDTDAALEWTIEVYWKRLLATCGGLAVATYLVVATSLYFWWARQPGNQVGWTDAVLAPVRWEELRRKRGDTAVAAALEQLRAKNYLDAYYGLRVGLARAPGNARGRIALAGLMSGNDPAGALKFLEDGLRHSPDDPDLLRALFNFYALYDSGARAREQTGQLLARTPPLSAASRAVLTREYATLLLALDRPTDAVRALDELGAADPAEIETERIRLGALIAAGRLGEAQTRLAARPRTHPVDQRLHAEWAAAARDAEALESALRLMRTENGEQPGTHLFAIRAWHGMGRATFREQEERRYLSIFGTSDSALQMLAALAVQLDLPATILLAQGAATRQRFNSFAFRMHLVELTLRHGEFDEAFRLLREIEPTILTLPPMQRQYPEFIQRLVRTCVAGGEHQLPLLLNLLGEMRARARPAMFTLAVDSLRRAGQPDSAAQMVGVGLRLYPYGDGLLLRQRELQATAKLRADAPDAAAASRAAPESAPTPLPATAAAALTALDTALRAERFTEAHGLLRAIRSAAPAWLAAAENDFAIREAELALATQDTLTARALVHAYLQRARPTTDLVRLAALVRDLAARDRVADARWLKQELENAGAAGAAAELLRAVPLPDDTAGTLRTAPDFLAAFDRHLASGQPADALALLELARKKSPAWLTGARLDLLPREVRARFAADQRVLALAAVKDLAVQSGASRSVAFKLARDLRAEGELERSRLVAREIVRLLPDDKAAATLLREMEPPDGGG